MMTIQKSLLEDKAMISKMIAASMPLKKILHVIVSKIEAHCDFNRLSGSIMLYNPLSNQLAETVSVSLSANFIQTIGSINVSPYGGSCGTAAFLKQPVFVSDIEHNPLWEEHRHIAVVYGYRACWSIPLLSSDHELLGAIVLYSHEVGKPNEETMQVINCFSKLASRAIELSKKSKNNHVHILYSF